MHSILGKLWVVFVAGRSKLAPTAEDGATAVTVDIVVIA